MNKKLVFQYGIVFIFCFMVAYISGIQAERDGLPYMFQDLTGNNDCYKYFRAGQAYIFQDGNIEFNYNYDWNPTYRDCTALRRLYEIRKNRDIGGYTRVTVYGETHE